MANREALRRTAKPAGRAACRPRARRRPSSRGWRSNAPATAFCCRSRRPARSSRCGHCCRCRTRSPGSLGVANLRGGLHGVVDLAAFLGMQAQRGRRGARAGSPGRASTRRWARTAHCWSTAWPACAAPGNCTAEPDGGERPRPAFAGARWRDARRSRAGRRLDLRRWRATSSSWASSADAPHRQLTQHDGDHMSFLDKIKTRAAARARSRQRHDRRSTMRWRAGPSTTQCRRSGTADARHEATCRSGTEPRRASSIISRGGAVGAGAVTSAKRASSGDRSTLAERCRHRLAADRQASGGAAAAHPRVG